MADFVAEVEDLSEALPAAMPDVVAEVSVEG